MIQLSIPDTFLALVPLLPVLIIFVYLKLNSRELMIAIARMALQLVMIGYALNFLFSHNDPWLGIMILSFMLAISSTIVIRPVVNKDKSRYLRVLFSLGIAAMAVLIWVLKFVIELNPWYQPSYVIPIAGMILANGMTGLSICAERIEKELARGTSRSEANLEAFNAALIPQINSFLAVGLVALPGMMTGQILSGVSPLVAVRYQIMVMSMIMATTCISVAIYLWLEQRNQLR